MMNKVKAYFGEIKEAEKLERRSMKQWEEKGTKEEALKVFKLQKRKQRNNTIAGLVSIGIYGSLMAYVMNETKKI